MKWCRKCNKLFKPYSTHNIICGKCFKKYRKYGTSKGKTRWRRILDLVNEK